MQGTLAGRSQVQRTGNADQLSKQTNNGDGVFDRDCMVISHDEDDTLIIRCCSVDIRVQVCRLPSANWYSDGTDTGCVGRYMGGQCPTAP